MAEVRNVPAGGAYRIRTGVVRLEGGSATAAPMLHIAALAEDGDTLLLMLPHKEASTVIRPHG